MLQMILLLTSRWITAQGLPGTLYPFMLIALKKTYFHIYFSVCIRKAIDVILLFFFYEFVSEVDLTCFVDYLLSKIYKWYMSTCRHM